MAAAAMRREREDAGASRTERGASHGADDLHGNNHLPRTFTLVNGMVWRDGDGGYRGRFRPIGPWRRYATMVETHAVRFLPLRVGYRSVHRVDLVCKLRVTAAWRIRAGFVFDIGRTRYGSMVGRRPFAWV